MVNGGRRKERLYCSIEILALLRNAGSPTGQDFYYSYNSTTYNVKFTKKAKR